MMIEETVRWQRISACALGSGKLVGKEGLFSKHLVDMELEND